MNADCVGILCGCGNLIVLDIDDIKYMEDFDKKANTFSVKTGGGKRHYYFMCKEQFTNSYYVLSNKAGELRIKNSQVLVPPSPHPSGNKYEVFHDVAIREINKEEIRILIGDLLFKNGNMIDTTRSGQEWREVCSMVSGNYSFDECDNEMRILGYAKWIEAPMSYRIGTYCNAVKFIKSKHLNIT